MRIARIKLELLKSQDGDLTETKEMLTPHAIEEETLTISEKVVFNLKNTSEGL